MRQTRRFRITTATWLTLAGFAPISGVAAAEFHRIGDRPGWELPVLEGASPLSPACDAFWPDATTDSRGPTLEASTRIGRSGISHSPGHPAKPRNEQPGDIDRGDCPPFRYSIDDHQRAGRPHCVAAWASPSINRRYSAWFVGGGAVWGGRGRKSAEGVWGLDYQGWLPGRRVWLNWTGGRHQGGEGAYQSDGHTGPWSRH